MNLTEFILISIMRLKSYQIKQAISDRKNHADKEFIGSEKNIQHISLNKRQEPI